MVILLIITTNVKTTFKLETCYLIPLMACTREVFSVNFSTPLAIKIKQPLLETTLKIYLFTSLQREGADLDIQQRIGKAIEAFIKLRRVEEQNV